MYSSESSPLKIPLLFLLLFAFLFAFVFNFFLVNKIAKPVRYNRYQAKLVATSARVKQLPVQKQGQSTEAAPAPVGETK
jgi:hypothetical protein